VSQLLPPQKGSAPSIGDQELNFDGTTVRATLEFLAEPAVAAAVRLGNDTQIAGNLRDQLAGLNHHPHGLSPKLRTELTALLTHETDPLS
jgi:hypothetical protein